MALITVTVTLSADQRQRLDCTQLGSLLMERIPEGESWDQPGPITMTIPLKLLQRLLDAYYDAQIERQQSQVERKLLQRLLDAYYDPAAE